MENVAYADDSKPLFNSVGHAITWALAIHCKQSVKITSIYSKSKGHDHGAAGEFETAAQAAIIIRTVELLEEKQRLALYMKYLPRNGGWNKIKIATASRLAELIESIYSSEAVSAAICWGSRVSGFGIHKVGTTCRKRLFESRRFAKEVTAQVQDIQADAENVLYIKFSEKGLV